MNVIDKNNNITNRQPIQYSVLLIESGENNQKYIVYKQ